MDFTSKQERMMIARRFCNNIEKAAVGLYWTDLESSTIDEMSEVEDQDEIDEIVKRMDRNLEHIVDRMDTAERVEELINQEDKRSFLFPWFWGNHYQVEIEGGSKRVRKGPAEQERERFKKEVESFIEREENQLSLLRSVLKRGRIGEIEAKDLISDMFVACFPLMDGEIEYSKEEKRGRFEMMKEDGWSEHFQVSSASTLRTSEYKALSDLNGFHVLENELQLEHGFCQIFIASELISAVEEIFEESEEGKTEWEINIKEMDLTNRECEKFESVLKKEGWEEILKRVLAS